MIQFHNAQNFPKSSEEADGNVPDVEVNEKANQEDTDPPLDEEDLEENDLTVEEADQIVWDPPATGSAGSEEKDITD